MADIEADISGSKPEPGTVPALDPSSQAQLPVMEAPLNADGQVPYEAGNPPPVDSNTADLLKEAPEHITEQLAASGIVERAATESTGNSAAAAWTTTRAAAAALRATTIHNSNDGAAAAAAAVQAPAAAPTAAAAAANELPLTPEPGPLPPAEGRWLREDEQRVVDQSVDLAWSANYDQQGKAARLEFKGPNVGAQTTGRLMAAATAQLMRRGEAAAQAGQIQGLKTALRAAVERHFPAAKKAKPTLDGDKGANVLVETLKRIAEQLATCGVDPPATDGNSNSDPSGSAAAAGTSTGAAATTASSGVALEGGEARARLMREALTQIDLLLAKLAKIEDQNTGGPDVAGTTTAGAADSTAPGM